jgi:hydrogenase nickel incorporation protein HypB
MSDVKIIDVKATVTEINDKRADILRENLKKNNTYMVNLMSSPGSGKTTLLVALLNKLKDKLKIGVMEADLDADVDTHAIKNKTGCDAIQLHTGGCCHLDAVMSKEGLDNLEEDLDLVFIENVGNLICPAEFDTGAHLDIMILSIPEGDDKPIKYPFIFSMVDVCIFSKIDTLKVFDFNIELAESHIRKLNDKVSFFPVSAKAGEGIDELADYIYNKVKEYQSK